MAKLKEGYYHVGDVLRDALVEDIGSVDWGDGQAQADKVKSALLKATPRRGGYLLDTEGWTYDDVDFLRETIDSVKETEGHSFMSGGVRLGSTRIGRQLYALRDRLDDD